MLILLLYNGLHPQVLNDVVESSFEMEVLDKISAAVNFHRTWLIPAMNTSASFNRSAKSSPVRTPLCLPS